nr:hypothetical protein [uncultured Pedobacter sp.]
MQIFTKSAILSTCLMLGIGVNAFSQSPLSGFMQGKKGGGITFSTTHEHYNSAYLFPTPIDAIPVFNEVSVNSFNIYGVYGVSDKLDVIVNVPFVETEGHADQAVLDGLGYTNTESGAQDLSAFAKYQFAKKGNIAFQAGAGITTPLSNYSVARSLQSIISIGNQATTYNGFLLAHFKDERGFFVTGQVGYSFRTTEVPNAVLSQLTIGLATSRFYISGQVGNQTSTSGVDILRPGFTNFFPATKVNYTKFGGTVYAPIDGNLGISFGGGAVVDGRNVGKTYYGSAGLTYNFIYKALAN